MVDMAHAGPRLLAGVSCCSGEAQGRVTAYVVEESGEDRLHEDVRLPDLIKTLWPTEKRTSNPSLRLLNDFTKHDFLIRRTHNGSILVRSDFARALIEPTRAIFLGTENPMFVKFKGEVLETMRSHQAQDAENKRNFEFFMLECLVGATVNLHTSKLQLMKPVIEDILQSVELTASEANILRLYPLKVALSNFVEHVRPVSACLRSLVHNEPDIERHRCIFCHPPARSRQLSVDQAADDWHPDQPPPGSFLRSKSISSSFSYSEDVFENRSEEVIETWAHNTEEILAEAIDLAAKVEDATRFLEASLSYMRNRLLRFELGATCVSLAFAFGALVSGIFGMNLKSGLEDLTTPFWYVLCGMLLVGFSICYVGRYLYMQSKRHYLVHCDRYGDNAFFRQITNDAYILNLRSAAPSPDGSISDATREQVMRDLRTPNLPMRQPRVSRNCLSQEVSTWQPPSSWQLPSSQIERGIPLLSTTGQHAANTA